MTVSSLLYKRNLEAYNRNPEEYIGKKIRKEPINPFATDYSEEAKVPLALLRRLKEVFSGSPSVLDYRRIAPLEGYAMWVSEAGKTEAERELGRAVKDVAKFFSKRLLLAGEAILYDGKDVFANESNSFERYPRRTVYQVISIEELPVLDKALQTLLKNAQETTLISREECELAIANVKRHSSRLAIYRTLQNIDSAGFFKGTTKDAKKEKE